MAIEVRGLWPESIIAVGFNKTKKVIKLKVFFEKKLETIINI